MGPNDRNHTQDHVIIHNVEGGSNIVLVCEHASAHIPEQYDGLGLSPSDRNSHAVWDPGAMALAEELSHRLQAPLVASGVSRLVYDCNRPPSSPSAMPARSEVINVPGNTALSQAERDARAATFYAPFCGALREAVERVDAPILVTVHSYTPVFHGQTRAVEIGILHDSDTRLADAMLDLSHQHTSANVQRNAPYGPEDGVTHTLKEHGVAHGHLNVMLEVRNDLLETAVQQSEMAQMISGWLLAAIAHLGVQGDLNCQA